MIDIPPMLAFIGITIIAWAGYEMAKVEDPYVVYTKHLKKSMEQWKISEKEFLKLYSEKLEEVTDADNHINRR